MANFHRQPDYIIITQETVLEPEEERPTLNMGSATPD